MRAHAVHLGTPFATSFQAAASTFTPAGAEEAMAKKIKITSRCAPANPATRRRERCMNAKEPAVVVTEKPEGKA